MKSKSRHSNGVRRKRHEGVSRKSTEKQKRSGNSSSRLSGRKKSRAKSRDGGNPSLHHVSDAASVAFTVALLSTVLLRGGSSHAALQSAGQSPVFELQEAVQTIPSAKIVGGATAPPGRYSYPLALAIQGRFCGGSLINSDTVLTAAHCVTKAPRGPCNIDRGIAVIGASNILYPKGSHEKIKLSGCSVHPGYKQTPEGLVEYDVAVVKLERSSRYPPVWLDSGKHELKANDELTVMGWGRTGQYGQGISPSLMHVNTKYMSQEKCDNVMKGAVGDSHLCCWAGTSLRESPYSGDSGGPLVVKSLGDARNQDIQVGIVSMVMGSLNPNFPALYVRVAHVADWIKENADGVRFAGVNEAKVPSDTPLSLKIAALCAMSAAVGFAGGAGGQELRYRRRDRAGAQENPPAELEGGGEEEVGEYEFAAAET